MNEPTLQIPNVLPVYVMHEHVVFPHMVFPLFARADQLAVVEEAMHRDHLIGLILCRTGTSCTFGDLAPIGTLCRIRQMMRLPDGGAKVIVEGLLRVRLKAAVQEQPWLLAMIDSLDDEPCSGLVTEALVQSVNALLKIALAYGRPLPGDVLKMIDRIDEPGRLADLVAVYLNLDVVTQQRVLETLNPLERLKDVYLQLTSEVQKMQVRGEVQSEVAERMGKTQKEYILREQMRQIQEELGDEDSRQSELNELRHQVDGCRDARPCPGDRREGAAPAGADQPGFAGTHRVPHLHRVSVQCAVAQRDRGPARYRPGRAGAQRRSLQPEGDQGTDSRIPGGSFPEGDHQGADSLLRRPAGGRQDLPRPVDRPGHGAQVHPHVAGRHEGRGGNPWPPADLHRCAAGRIIQEICRVEANNPVFMLDEVDKIGQDFRGDPASALLEVLDPEQNDSFTDHYLDVPFDLSRVMFIATANVLDPVPPALRDRMEVISLPGYSDEEKLQIAFRYLIPKQIEENGLAGREFAIDEAALKRLIRDYTREAGVRNLERQIASLCRKVAKQIAEGGEPAQADSRGRPGKAPWSAAFLHQRRRRGGPGRGGHRTGLDRSRGRHHLRRGDAHGGQGRADPDRQPRRGHAGVGPDRPLLRARQCARRSVSIPICS